MQSHVRLSIFFKIPKAAGRQSVKFNPESNASFVINNWFFSELPSKTHKLFYMSSDYWLVQIYPRSFVEAFEFTKLPQEKYL